MTLLDITPKAVDSEHRGTLPFIEACLWEFVGGTKWDWLYCCDVLEHIPPEYVDAVLDNLQAMTGKGAFMQIALWPEHWGDKIGETLHLTVEPAIFWQKRIDRRWTNTVYTPARSDRLIVLTGAPK